MDSTSNGIDDYMESDYCTTKLGLFVSYMIFIGLLYPTIMLNISTKSVLIYITGLLIGEIFLIVNVYICSTYYIIHAITYFILVSIMTITWYCYTYKKNFHNNFEAWNPNRMRFPELHKIILRIMSSVSE